MNLILNPDTQAYVDEKVRKGEFSSAQDVINSALLRLKGDDELDGAELDALRGQIAVGVAEADRGDRETWDVAEIAAKVERRYRE